MSEPVFDPASGSSGPATRPDAEARAADAGAADAGAADAVAADAGADAVRPDAAPGGASVAASSGDPSSERVAASEDAASLPAPSGDPSSERVAAIDQAAAASLAAPEDVAVQERLWRAVFSLDHWVFIARGGDDEPTPFALSTDEGPVIFAFSTAERARSAAVGFGIPEDEARRLLAVPLPSAAAWVASYAEAGVDAMVFDAPTIGAMAPLSNLAAMAVYISQNPDA